MGTKIEVTKDKVSLVYLCPGCGLFHRINHIKVSLQPVWDWNKSFDKPSLYPSVKGTLLMYVDGKQKTEICHHFVNDGKIRFCSDSTHKLAGKTVPMIDVSDWSNDNFT